MEPRFGLSRLRELRPRLHTRRSPPATSPRDLAPGGSPGCRAPSGSDLPRDRYPCDGTTSASGTPGRASSAAHRAGGAPRAPGHRPPRPPTRDPASDPRPRGRLDPLAATTSACRRPHRLRARDGAGPTCTRAAAPHLLQFVTGGGAAAARRSLTSPPAGLPGGLSLGHSSSSPAVDVSSRSAFRCTHNRGQREGRDRFRGEMTGTEDRKQERTEGSVARATRPLEVPPALGSGFRSATPVTELPPSPASPRSSRRDPAMRSSGPTGPAAIPLSQDRGPRTGTCTGPRFFRARAAPASCGSS